eukprot:2816019-Rhodomonas_salina.1
MKSRISRTSGCTLPPEPPLGCRRVLPIAALRPGTPCGAPPGVSGSRDCPGRIERPASTSA